MKVDQDNIYVFNETVTGSLHIKRDIGCEDASASYVSDDNRIQIAVVADGHGSDQYFRSSTGSQLAVEVALKILLEFSKNYLRSKDNNENFYDDFLEDPRTQRLMVKQLTDSIVSQWYDRVMEDFYNYPAEEEIPENEIPQIYGTTLLAAVMLPEFVLFIHQGDGRCEVFYEDGSFDQPVPWDEKCVGNVTTSLCDIDAAQRIRTLILRRDLKDVIALFLGSDGVDDTYWDSDSTGEGLSVFYKNLLTDMSIKGLENFKNELSGFLSDFSMNGQFVNNFSGDDVSVSGIVNLTKVAPYLEKYYQDVNRFIYSEQLRQLDTKHKSMSLKHEVLETRVKEKEARYNQALADKAANYDDLVLKDQEVSELLAEIETNQIRLDEFENQDFEEELIAKLSDDDKMLYNLTEEFQRRQGPIYRGFKSLISKEIRSLKKKQKKLTRIYRQKIDEYNDLLIERDEIEVYTDNIMAEYDLIKSDFLDYDNEYKKLEENIDELKREIDQIENTYE